MRPAGVSRGGTPRNGGRPEYCWLRPASGAAVRRISVWLVTSTVRCHHWVSECAGSPRLAAGRPPVPPRPGGSRHRLVADVLHPGQAPGPRCQVPWGAGSAACEYIQAERRSLRACALCSFDASAQAADLPLVLLCLVGLPEHCQQYLGRQTSKSRRHQAALQPL
jgi:hypothetical protein